MNQRRHPDWLKVQLPKGENFNRINYLKTGKTHTICEEAKCPNHAECWGRGTATFLILGNRCTRNCSYCNVKSGKPPSIIDVDEPKNVASIINRLGLKYAVITSVTRDDLDDGGAFIFAETINEIKKISPQCKIEVLIPDFRGNEAALKKVIDTCPDVIGHNIEVAKRLFPSVRPQGSYELSLKVLKKIKEINEGQKTKSSLMAGLGETKEEILQAMHDLRKAGCDFFTLGQYLQPSKQHHPIIRYYTPSEFKDFENIGYKYGFSFVKAGPLVRSSYMAEEALRNEG